MRSLRELQLGFAEAIFSQETSEFAQEIAANGLSGEHRLAIYRNNVFTRLTEALRSVYPVVQQLVGEGFFKFASAEYISRYPSQSGDLHHYGRQFAEFLANFPPAAELSYLSDVARLEWACHEVFHEADHGPLALEQLQAVPPERYGDLKFRLHPAARLIASSFPVHRIWEVNQPGYSGDQTLELAEGEVRLLVKRSARIVELYVLTSGEWCFLGMLADGRSFGEACEAAFVTEPGFGLEPALRRWVADLTLVDFVEAWPAIFLLDIGLNSKV
ncbi:MAG: hypothetical protein BGO61_13055 [Thiobacillus sp. 65-69]|nr:putative DNA-binding domain-containing protein [Thiobacillus sp.]OJW38504.1 MAG: hypothetical protein BGO61_13055 [Thiobacillus sp. 65-69]